MKPKDIYADYYRTEEGVKNCWTVETQDSRFIHFFSPAEALAFYLTGDPELETKGIPYED